MRIILNLLIFTKFMNFLIEAIIKIGIKISESLKNLKKINRYFFLADKIIRLYISNNAR